MEPQEHKQRVMEGVSIFGTARKYTFALMPALTGLRLFHAYITILANILPDIAKHLPKLKNLGQTISGETDDIVKIELNDDLMELIRMFPAIFTWERIEELAKEMLAGSQVEIDGEIHKVDESGIGAYTLGDPLELYTAIAYGIMANYRPFFKSLTADENDSTQGSGQK